jgi:hypothetical protein
MTTYIYKDELYHHGIKGQKWGIRRYQNPDGSLTKEGYIRYGKNKALEETEKQVYDKLMKAGEAGQMPHSNKLWKKASEDYDFAEEMRKTNYESLMGAYLKDIGYQDTKSGRAYIRNILEKDTGALSDKPNR